MLRLFETSTVRKQTELDGMWYFSVDEGEHFDYSLAVPGCWEEHPTLRTYRGVGIYKKNFFMTHKANLRLIFKGISHTCEIWLDEKNVGKIILALFRYTLQRGRDLLLSPKYVPKL